MTYISDEGDALFVRQQYELKKAEDMHTLNLICAKTPVKSSRRKRMLRRKGK